MKKLFKNVGMVVLAIFLAAIAIPGMRVNAEDLQSGDYTYTVNSDGTVNILKYNGTATELEIPGSIEGMDVTGISKYAFEECKSVVSVTIPDTVKRIGMSAFKKCVNLEKIVIPESVTSVDMNIFNGCTKLATAGPIGSGCNIEFGWTTTIPKWAFCLSEIVSITIPEGVQTIESYAFSECSRLTSIIIPASVSKIGTMAFQNSELLVTAGPAGSGSNIEFGWTECIPDSAFEYSAIESITIPDGIKEIGKGAFTGSKLKSVTIPGSVGSIPSYTFYSCTSLTSVIIKDGPVSIGTSAFTGCKNLKRVVIPASVTKIDEFSFESNETNESLVIYGQRETTAEAYSTDKRVKFVVIGNENGWVIIDGVEYWYEEGVRQGYDPDDPSYRGKEIYDPGTDAWYWLDNVQNGAVAKNKDVYQESAAGVWGDYYIHAIKMGKWVRYDENGHMIKGWQETEAGTYYFDQTYGTMAKGEAYIDGKKYCFDETTGILVGTGPGSAKDDDGRALSEDGWHKVGGVNYWYEGGVRQGYDPDNSDYRGKEIYDPASGAWYWLDNVQDGAVAKSKDVYQESLAGQWGDRTNEAGEKIGKWVRYDENGHMIKGWSEKDGNRYYFDPTYGTMAKGKAVIDGQTYYFDVNTGVLQ